MTNSKFSELGLAEPIQRALINRNHVTPTPIQARAIPELLAGRDMLGIAQTGTGKTAAFALPILHQLSQKRGAGGRRSPRALVLAPTRELAIQINDEFRAYGKDLHLRQTVIMGGVGQRPQVNSLSRGVDILIATPGRLLDLMNQRQLVLDAVEFFVLDEADRMLDMGFVRDVRRIAAALPAKRQTLLFSATMPAEIARLSGEILADPVRVEVTPQATPIERLEQSIYHVDAGGKVAQAARQRALKRFRSGDARVLVATDIAARGIDVDSVSHVINFELPNEPESYVHRIGRTARAGAGGIALSFCDPTERGYLRDIERLIRRRLTVIGDAPAAAAPDAFNKSKKPGGKSGGKPWHKRGVPRATAENSNNPPHRARRRRRAA